jgi:hypothetical protein
MNRFLLFALGAALGGCGDASFFDTINGGSSPNACSSGATRATVTRVEISESDQYSAMPRPFTALEDGASVTIVRGFQGADMIVLSIRVHGLDAPACLAQRTDVTDAMGARVTTNGQPLMFMPTAGVATNERMFFPGNYQPGSYTITTTVAGVTVTRTVQAVRT